MVSGPRVARVVSDERLLEELRTGEVLGEGDCAAAQGLFGVEEDGLVDEVLGEEGSVEVGAALEQEAEEIALGEEIEDGGKAEAAGVLGKDLDFGAGCVRGRRSGSGGVGAAEDEEVVRRRSGRAAS